MTVKVTLDIYSGWTEPEWYLRKEEIGKIRSKLQGLPSANPDIAERLLSDLDYRGFILNNIKEPKFPDYVRVLHSVLIISDEGEKIYKKDINNIEELLLAQAIKRGYSEILPFTTNY